MAYHDMEFFVAPHTADGKAIDPNAPLIYLWEVVNGEGVVIGKYVGKAEGGNKRPLKHYRRNVIKLLKGKPYKSGKSYRRVHYGLAAAVQAGHTIKLTYVCNVPPSHDIFEVEAEYIRLYGCLDRDGAGLNGPGPRPYVALPPVTAAPEQVEGMGNIEDDVDGEDEGLDQLEYVQRYILEAFPQLTDTPRKQGISFWVRNGPPGTGPGSKEGRILRIESTPSGKKLMLKQAQTWRSDRSLPDIAWDGTDVQLHELVRGEIEEYCRRTGYEI